MKKIDIKERIRLKKVIEELKELYDISTRIILDDSSNCCNSSMIVAGKTTRYYVCTICKQPCDSVRT